MTAGKVCHQPTTVRQADRAMAVVLDLVMARRPTMALRLITTLKPMVVRRTTIRRRLPARTCRPPLCAPGTVWIDGYNGVNGYCAVPPYSGAYWIGPSYYGGRFIAGYWGGPRGFVGGYGFRGGAGFVGHNDFRGGAVGGRAFAGNSFRGGAVGGQSFAGNNSFRGGAQGGRSFGGGSSFRAPSAGSSFRGGAPNVRSSGGGSRGGGGRSSGGGHSGGGHR